MILRSTIYWLLSILILVLCLTYSQSTPDNKTTKPVALTSYLKVEPKFFYYNNNQFHATVTGQLRLDIKTELIPEDISNFNALIIEGYQFKQGTEFSLNWQVNEQPYQILINQTMQSINRINFETDDATEISDMHLLITSTQELGLENNYQEVVSFKSIRLDQQNKLSQLATNLSEWNDFNSVKLSAINGYTNSTDLQYKTLILRLSSWLILVALMFWLIRIKGTHFIATIFLAWLISSYFFITNHVKQHNQINQSFPPEQSNINRLDQETHDLAQLITAKIKSSPTLFSNPDKLILIGANTFFKLRLMHHLIGFNIALKFDIQKLLHNQDNPNAVYLLTENQLVWCNGQQVNYWLMKQVNIIHVDNDFCLLRKK